MRLLRRGEISVREAALLADVSRQRVLAWCRNTAIDPRAARAEWLARLMESANKRDRY